MLFVSYVGSKGHRPKWIALGSAIMGVGSIVFLLPHIVAEPYDYRAVGMAVLILSLNFYIFVNLSVYLWFAILLQIAIGDNGNPRCDVIGWSHG